MGCSFPRLKSCRIHRMPIDTILAEETEYYSLQKKVWRILAPFYDLLTAPFSRLRDRAVSFTDAATGSKILDVATGTGEQAFAFAKKGYDVTGVDLSDAMLRVARKKNEYSNVKFEAADAAGLPFGDSEFDVSFISFALHEMPPTIRAKVLKEAARVTKQDGLIMISDYALPAGKVLRRAVYLFVRLYEGELFSRFINTDLEAVLRESGIEVKEELRLLFGAAKILKTVKSGR